MHGVKGDGLDQITPTEKSHEKESAHTGRQRHRRTDAPPRNSGGQQRERRAGRRQQQRTFAPRGQAFGVHPPVTEPPRPRRKQRRHVHHRGKREQQEARPCPHRNVSRSRSEQRQRQQRHDETEAGLQVSLIALRHLTENQRQRDQQQEHHRQRRDGQAHAAREQFAANQMARDATCRDQHGQSASQVEQERSRPQHQTSQHRVAAWRQKKAPDQPVQHQIEQRHHRQRRRHVPVGQSRRHRRRRSICPKTRGDGCPMLSWQREQAGGSATEAEPLGSVGGRVRPVCGAFGGRTHRRIRRRRRPSNARDRRHRPGPRWHESGATGPGHGVYEKNVTLALAGRIRDLLMTGAASSPPITVVLCRETDTLVPIRARARCARESGARLFLSLHANAVPTGIPRGTQHGFEVFVLGPHEVEDDAALAELAERDDAERCLGRARGAGRGGAIHRPRAPRIRPSDARPGCRWRGAG